MARSVSSLEQVRLNDSDQWILVRGDDVEQPVILFLHGGPGTSQLTLNKHNTRALERRFVVVNWDQRGAGKSYAAIRDATRMTIEQFVDDVHALTELLCARFGKSKIVLVGHSFGSVLGVLAAQRWPGRYHGYVGIGQVANMLEGERASYAWTLQAARAAGDRSSVRALEAMGPPPYAGDWQRHTIRQRSILARHGGECHGRRTGAAGLVLRHLLWSREYGARDRINYFRGIMGSMRLLWPSLLEVDLFAAVPALEIPVYFMLGRHDWEVPSVIAERYFQALSAPQKALFWFESSGHLPNAEQRDEFNAIVLGTIRASLPERC